MSAYRTVRLAQSDQTCMHCGGRLVAGGQAHEVREHSPGYRLVSPRLGYSHVNDCLRYPPMDARPGSKES